MNISVILPIHEYNEEIDVFLKQALKSVAVQDGVNDKRDVLIVYASTLDNNKEWVELMNSYKEWEEQLNIIYLKNEEKTDFQSQINFGAKQVKTKWFSILEFDDEYSTTYFKIMNEYTNSSDFKNIEVLLPIIVETNEKSQALKLTNETVWSKQFVGENGVMGYLNKDALNQYTDFKICGAVINTNEFVTAGGLKPNIKLTFQYEFFLRFINNASKVYTVPKIGYKHLMIREGSLFDTIAKTMDIKERGFWFDTAKKESNFFNDRNIDFLSFEKTKNTVPEVNV